MPKISDAHREARRAEITDAALRCFMRNGYQHTSMADIIAESGLSAGAIYVYFAGKEQLLHSVAARIVTNRRDELVAAEAEHPLSIAAIASILIEGMRREAPLPVLIQVWGEATVNDELRAHVESSIGEVRSAIVDALTHWATRHTTRIGTRSPDEWAVANAPVVLSIVHGFAFQRALVTDFDEEAFIHAIGEFLPND